MNEKVNTCIQKRGSLLIKDPLGRERVFVTSSRPFIDKHFAVVSCERP